VGELGANIPIEVVMDGGAWQQEPRSRKTSRLTSKQNKF